MSIDYQMQQVRLAQLAEINLLSPAHQFLTALQILCFYCFILSALALMSILPFLKVSGNSMIDLPSITVWKNDTQCFTASDVSYSQQLAAFLLLLLFKDRFAPLQTMYKAFQSVALLIYEQIYLVKKIFLFFFI